MILEKVHENIYNYYLHHHYYYPQVKRRRRLCVCAKEWNSKLLFIFSFD